MLAYLSLIFQSNFEVFGLENPSVISNFNRLCKFFAHRANLASPQMRDQSNNRQLTEKLFTLLMKKIDYSCFLR